MAGSEFREAFGGLKKSEFYEAPAAKPERPAAAKSSGYSILVSNRQRGNPLLKAICTVPWEFADIVPDYILGAKTCALFLSLRYYQLNPGYLAGRLDALGRSYELQVLLVQVDIREPHHVLKELTKTCLQCDLTLMLAWSAEEAGRIIDTYKAYEHKPPDMIQTQQAGSAHAQVVEALTSVRSVNKTDAAALLTAFGSLEKVIQATEEELCLCPGMGPSKAKRLYEVLHMPVKRTRKRGS